MSTETTFLQALTLGVLLAKVGLLPLQLPLSPSLCGLDLLTQTLHVALLLLHTPSHSGLLTCGETQLLSGIRFLDTIIQAQRSGMKQTEKL